MFAGYKILFDIRNELENAITAKSRFVDKSVFDVLDVMSEKAYEGKESNRIIVLDDLFYCASHVQMGVFFKAAAALPNEEAIAIAFPPDNN